MMAETADSFLRHLHQKDLVALIKRSIKRDTRAFFHDYPPLASHHLLFLSSSSAHDLYILDFFLPHNLYSFSLLSCHIHFHPLFCFLLMSDTHMLLQVNVQFFLKWRIQYTIILQMSPVSLSCGFNYIACKHGSCMMPEPTRLTRYARDALSSLLNGKCASVHGALLACQSSLGN